MVFVRPSRSIRTRYIFYEMAAAQLNCLLCWQLNRMMSEKAQTAELENGVICIGCFASNINEKNTFTFFPAFGSRVAFTAQYKSTIDLTASVSATPIHFETR